MCGFFGFVDLSGTISDEDQSEVLSGAESISYRGPDDSCLYKSNHLCVGFNRLSIIDLAAPSQPYINSEKNTVMLCNGEIYNYKELKKVLLGKGYIFKTNTDSEVVLHGYSEWGPELWTKLNGIFAIVIWDDCKKTLFLVRDPMGVKPIHYKVVGTRLFFSSDYNAFNRHNQSLLEPNLDVLLTYLSFRYVIGEQTFYKRVFDVLPGNFVKFSTESLVKRTYWDIPAYSTRNIKERSFLDKLDYQIEKAVNRQIISDVPIGSFISGGVDSSLLLYHLNRLRPDIQTFSAGFDGAEYNEFEYVDIICNHLSVNPNKILIEQNDYIGSMQEVIKYRGEPASIPHESAILGMAKQMAGNIKVVISGEGADELFGGYGRIFRSPLDYYKQKHLGKYVKYFPKIGHRTGFTLPRVFTSPLEHFLWRYSWFGEKEKASLLSPTVLENGFFDDSSLNYLTKIFDKFSPNQYYDTLYYVFGKVHLPGLLNRLDRMTMACSIEARVPFLDTDIVELAAGIPHGFKNRWKTPLSAVQASFSNSEKISELHDVPKYPLKQLCRGRMPDRIIDRKKMGFPVPLNRWFSDNYRESTRELLLSLDSQTREFVDQHQLSELLSQDAYTTDYDYDGKRLWMLLNLELWLRSSDYD